MRKENEYFIENFSMLVTSGMNILVALDNLKREIRSRSLKKKIDGIREDIDGGSPIWKALERSKVLPGRVIALIKIGEEGGRLSENFSVVVEGERKQRLFRSKVRSAMMYPLFVLVLTLVVGIGIAWFILPRLANVFASLDIELPFFTRWLIAAGKFLSAYGTIAVPAFVAVLALIIYIVFFFPYTKRVGQFLLLHTVGVSKLFKEVEISRFGFVLGTLLEAGMSVVDALHSLEESTEFRAYKKFYAFLAESISDGKSFAKSFDAYPKTDFLIPVTIQQLIVAGERSGKLSDVLKNIGRIFEERTDITTKNLTVVLEPILLVIVWLGVVGVALAIIMPIYSLIGGLN